MKKLIIIGFIFTAITMSGCGARTQQNAEQIQPQARNLCIILSSKDISNTMGYDVTIHKGLLPDTDFSSGCQFQNDDGYGVTAIYSYSNKYQTAKEQYEEAITLQKSGSQEDITIENASGVGESAYIWTHSKTVQLNALNKNTWITMTLIDDKPNKVERAKKLANQIFKKLEKQI